MIKTLLIKKKYYEEIKKGLKNVEYRAYTPYFKKLFKIKPDFIKFHFQGRTHIYATVIEIRVIKPSKFLKNQAKRDGIKIGNKLFRIVLGKIITKKEL